MKKYNPFKSYIIMTITLIIIVGIAFYAYKWYEVYQKEQTRESYLMKTNTISMQITNLGDFDTILMEAPNEYYIYISYTGSKDVLNLEKKLKKVIDNYGINDIVYYVDTTHMKNTYIDKINSALNINLETTPAIIYVKDNTATDDNIIQSKKEIIKANDFEELLKRNGIEKISQ